VSVLRHLRTSHALVDGQSDKLKIGAAPDLGARQWSTAKSW
jgi:hypothetical protein